MIPIITRVSDKNPIYNYGFRWSVRIRGYKHSVRTFQMAYRLCKSEISYRVLSFKLKLIKKLTYFTDVYI